MWHPHCRPPSNQFKGPTPEAVNRPRQATGAVSHAAAAGGMKAPHFRHHRVMASSRTFFLLSVACVATSLAVAQDAASAPSAVERAGHAVDRTAHRTGAAIERGAQRTGAAIGRGAERTAAAVQRGVHRTGAAIERGARRTGEAIGRGAQRTGRAIDRGAEKVGIKNSSAD